jgi:hypothetical protein
LVIKLREIIPERITPHVHISPNGNAGNPVTQKRPIPNRSNAAGDCYAGQPVVVKRPVAN